MVGYIGIGTDNYLTDGKLSKTDCIIITYTTTVSLSQPMGIGKCILQVMMIIGYE